VVQVAQAAGLRVIASAGPDNQDYLRELGAVPVLYGEGVADRVREAAGGAVDAVSLGGHVRGKLVLVPRPGARRSLRRCRLLDLRRAGS
jgi:hypothetical protein